MNCQELGHQEYLEGDNIVCLRCGIIIRKQENIEEQKQADIAQRISADVRKYGGKQENAATLVAEESCNHHAPGKPNCKMCHPAATLQPPTEPQVGELPPLDETRNPAEFAAEFENRMRRQRERQLLASQAELNALRERYEKDIQVEIDKRDEFCKEAEALREQLAAKNKQ